MTSIKEITINKPILIIILATVIVAWVGLGMVNVDSNKCKQRLEVAKAEHRMYEKERDILKSKLTQFVYNEEVDNLAIGKVRDYILHYYKKTPPIFAEIIAISIIKNCNKHKIDPAVIVGLIEQESAFNPYALSNKQARGLTQVRFTVWGETLGLQNASQLHEINTGIESGINVLKKYLGDAEGDLAEALYLYVGKDRKYVKDVYANIGKFGVFGTLTAEE